MSKPRVFVGMSGGVDSSVAAALCQQHGYEVVGVYMKNWTQNVGGVECAWREDLADAKSVAAHLGIGLEIFDFEQEYRERVVEYMLTEYRAGRTPNPDIMCNQEVKFKLFLDAALEQGADMIATGHYARILGDSGNPKSEIRNPKSFDSVQGRHLRQAQGRQIQNSKLQKHKTACLYAGTDQNKDQSYFLYRISADALDKTLFPLGGYTKPQVRQLAAEFGLPTADKPDSQGICFIGEVSIKEFLQEYINTAPGPIKHQTSGEVLGEHQGAVLYTIGQRHGLNIGGRLPVGTQNTPDAAAHGGLPLYVASKDMAENTVYVTEDRTALMQNHVMINDVHWINEPPRGDHAAHYVRTRHRGTLTPATVTDIDNHNATIELAEPERALAPGQSAVVYEETASGLSVLGGGIISG